MNVSVCVITFNQHKYIEQCIDSILEQIFEFDYEILIFDDCSTDDTRKVLREYKNKYPNKINLVFPDKNQFSQGVRGMFAKFLYPISKGKYIALCEGDDYWVDKKKLQKQYDFLEKNQDYSLVFTNRIIVDKHNKILRKEYQPSRDFTISDIFNGFVPSTQTIMMRNEPYISKVFNHYGNIYSGDRMTSYLCALSGKLYLLDDVTAAYRDTGSGIWSSFSELEALYKKTSLIKSFHNQLGLNHDDPKFIKNNFNRIFLIMKLFIKNPTISNLKLLYKYTTFLFKNFKYYNKTKVLKDLLISKLK